MSKSLVSIIIPAYNVENYIARSLTSLLDQSYNDICIIVIDDGSTDSTAEVAASYAMRDSRIKLIQQENSGAAIARNSGLKAVQGEFIMFVDADDMLAPYTVEQNIRFLIDNDELDWVSFPVRRIRHDGQSLRFDKSYKGFSPKEDKIIHRTEFISSYFSCSLSELCCGSIFRRSSVEDISFPAGEYYEDSFYFTAVIAQTRCGMISTHGEYQYLERENSSQHAELSYERLHSKMKSLLYRIKQFSRMAPQYESTYSSMEDSLYEFFLFQRLKGNPHADDMIKKFVNTIGRIPQLKLSTRMKHGVIRLLGYERLKALYHLFHK